MYAITAGDTVPALRLTLFDNGRPIDLTYYRAIVTIVSIPGADPIVSREATIIDALGGIVELAWLPGETVAGDYRVKVTLIDDNGDMRTIPGSGYGVITIDSSFRK